MTNDYLKSITPLNCKSYRLLYNLISGITFLITTSKVPSITYLISQNFQLEGFKFILFIIIISIAGLIGLLGFRNWNILGFLGLKEEHDPLNTQGIYAFSRHPVYLSALLFFITPLIYRIDAASLSWLLGAGGYFILGSIYEESKLQKAFDKYHQYYQNVGWFPHRKRHFEFLFQNIT